MPTNSGRRALSCVFVIVFASTLSAAGTSRAQAPTRDQHTTNPAAARSVIHCGALVDVVAGRVLRDRDIVVVGDRIESIAPSAEASASASALADSRIDLSEQTCMPGWIDMHVHLTLRIDAAAHAELFRLNPADYALLGAANASKTLRAGFTTVRNLGDTDNVSIALRNAVNQGLVEGPRIHTAGRAISATGGHADIGNGANMALMGDPGPRDAIIDSADDAWKAVRQHYKDGADLIKITATGGILSLARNGEGPQLRGSEIEAVVAAAKDYGFKVAAHAHGAEGIRRAVLAGVDSIEHGSRLDDDLIALMKQHGTWYVPTVSAGTYVAEQARIDGAYPEAVRPKAIALGPQAQRTLGQAYRAGVRIAFGSDAGATPHGDNAREFVEMVAAGMPPMAVLQSATVRAAELLGESARVGTLEHGKFADIVAVPGDPVTDIAVTAHPSFVMKGGRVYVQREAGDLPSSIDRNGASERIVIPANAGTHARIVRRPGFPRPRE